MKISEMTNNQATEAMIRLSGPISSICDDDEMMTILDELNAMKEKQDTPMIKLVGRIIPRFLTFGLAKHRDDIYEIVGALLSETADAVGRLNFAETVKAVRDSYDEVLASFFTRSASATRNSAE